MKLLDCPVIGKRPISEFDYLGEVRVPPSQADELVWADYVFNRKGAPGVLRERWYHRPTGRWFVFDRDTLTDEIVAVVDAADVRYEEPRYEIPA
ncbi:Sarcosine oxidase delta subunit [Marinobacterium lacunae]|uniref:Sarcosine oxidase delta subunit n=1 Tax=Marinobacterium lacunae TaxID=1232683 RepID=A0A081G064_9GAMM|nr:sarcosine oxidase subunit delta [Marinobacterium lacunae]KEA64169.1 Sarcosine oxidase delta subunit [Marinobacterium lacunae]MBR9885388.1 sarcosine oxidase subunit delta [Oceanospirillales bacterium]